VIGLLHRILVAASKRDSVDESMAQIAPRYFWSELGTLRVVAALGVVTINLRLPVRRLSMPTDTGSGFSGWSF